MRFAWVLLPLAAAAACDDQNVSQAFDAAIVDAAGSDAAAEAASDSSVVPKGTRVLGAGLDLGDPSFYSDLADLNDAGGHAIDLTLAWDQVETPFDAGPDADTDASTFIYAPALHAVNLVLPPARTTLALGAVAVDVGGARLPIDLHGKPFDDATVLARFDALVDYVLNQLPDTSLDVLLVGDRVDFGGDLERWQAFATFVAHAREHAHGKRTDLAVSFSVTPNILSRAAAAPALAAADLVAVSWPATDGPPPDFSALAAAPANKPIVLLGVGKPAGDGGQDSLSAQATFVNGTFASWDQSRISRITFAFLDDPHAETVAAEAARQGRTDPAFAAAFGSLGLRNASGAARPAFEAFRGQAHARGF